MSWTQMALVLTGILVLHGCSGGDCEYNGKEYSSGESFLDEGLCNRCSCGSDGRISCTTMACAPLVPQNGSWCVPKWGFTSGTGTSCTVNELQPDGTRLGELGQCSVDGGVGDGGAGACWQMIGDSSCTETGQRLSITPPSEATGNLFRVACY